MKTKQTAVNWLVEQIKSVQNQKTLSASEWMQVIEQAKQMEKEQIEDAFQYGKWNGFEGSMGREQYKDPAEYHRETYTEIPTEKKERPTGRVAVEFEPHTLNNRDWWFDLGVSVSKTHYHPDYRYVFTLSLVFYSLYVRWGKAK